MEETVYIHEDNQRIVDNFDVIYTGLHYRNKQMKKTTLSKQALQLICNFLITVKKVVSVTGKDVHIWNNNTTGSTDCVTFNHHKYEIERCIMSADNRFLLTVSILPLDFAISEAVLMNLETGGVKKFNLDLPYAKVAISQTGRYILYSYYDLVALYDTHSDKVITFEPHLKTRVYDGINSIDIAEDNKYEFIGITTLYNGIVILKSVKGKTVASLCTFEDVSRGEWWAAKISPDHKRIVAISYNCRVAIVDVDTAKVLKSVSEWIPSGAYPSVAQNLSFLPDSQSVVIKYRRENEGQDYIVVGNIYSHAIHIHNVGFQESSGAVNNNLNIMWETSSFIAKAFGYVEYTDLPRLLSFKRHCIDLRDLSNSADVFDRIYSHNENHVHGAKVVFETLI